MSLWRRAQPERSAGPVQRRASASDIALAYRLILGREPDESGHAHYLGRVRAGLSVSDLVDSLLQSEEYRLRQDQPLPSGAAAAASEAERESGQRRDRRPTDLLSPADVIRQTRLEDLLETADEYYRRVTDPTPLMAKPFAFLHEAPEMLQNLGLVLDGLQLGRTMTVLDFGCGTCWLSRCLAQLNCQPICCDSSAAALAIGRRLFEASPLIGTAVFTPAFLRFDGRRLDLPDDSVDRIVCFDAFHHVPNQAEVLGEFSRVLKDGGIAGFSEPGRRHSESPQSQYEMRNHRVLENDIVPEEIFAIARAAGFTGMTVKVLNDLEIGVTDYEAVIHARAGRDLSDRLSAGMRDAMANRAIFFLYKGRPRRDSRSHIGLSHRMVCDTRRVAVRPGDDLHVTVRLLNDGESTWLSRNTEIFGIVRLATHLYDAAGRLREIDHSRHALPRDVAPGEEVTMTVTIPVPGPDPCRIAIDLVAEGVTWFENIGAAPVSIEIVRS